MDVVDAAGHPMHFPPEHPLVVRVRALCLAYPEAVEAISHGRCTFRAGKRQFALVGVRDAGAVLFIPDGSERFALVERDDVFVPPYEGAYGWLALRVEADSGDWSLLSELLDTSYRQVALQRQLRALDARDEGAITGPA
ncbi:MmcQ/YjbR family DNA-binding protein [Microbacterium sulfonylureivorans]|uniref:MmcQ/YjbR family DNA-binding protein n=1 Tax=Microbacterium sulfonylureivorans TaxID=2486854 RepID=UPI000FD75BDC|nr:MmcQ/YjbR family DNA-binding protein [Microbacterium sulfonylureivorans]